MTKPHGYIFEVPVERAVQRASRSPRPVASPTRRSPSTRTEGILYLTEDNFAFPSGFYRYLPPSNPMDTGHLEDGGQLQMLKVVGVDNAHLEAAQDDGTTLRVEWVDIDDPNPQFPYTPGLSRADHRTTRPSCTSATRAGRRARPASPASRARSSTRRDLLHLDAGRRRGGDRTELIAGYGNGNGQVWAYRPATRR